MRRRFNPTTLHLLLMAFGLAAAVAVSAAAGIYQSSLQEHRQLRQIMENGLPSMLAAVRMQEILPQLSFDRLPGGSLQLVPKSDFDETVRRFRANLAGEGRRPLTFAGEDVLLGQMAAQLDHVVALDAQLRRPGTVGRDRTVAAFEVGLARLRATCDRYHRLNDRGMVRARATLTRTAEEDDVNVIRSMIGILLLWSISAALLVWSIARPLAGLTSRVQDLPQSGRLEPIALVPWTPVEIRRLTETFAQAASAISHEAAVRRQAQADLESALAREHALSVHLAQANTSLDEQVRQKTAELAAAVAALQAKGRARSSFLAAVSHELRAPLAVITGASRTLIDLGPRLPAEAAGRLVASVAAESDHLSALLSDLLDVARQDAGAFRIAVEADVDAGALLASVAINLAPLFEARHIRLLVSDTDGLPAIVADPERLRQILRNLFENAAKYAPAGSTVRVAMAVAPADDRPERLTLVVDDEGPSVPEDLRARLFTAFDRGEGYQLEQGGTGLGLAVARQLVEAHGGDIGVGDAPGGGCRFWFWLPLTGPLNRSS